MPERPFSIRLEVGMNERKVKCFRVVFPNPPGEYEALLSHQQFEDLVDVCKRVLAIPDTSLVPGVRRPVGCVAFDHVSEVTIEVGLDPVTRAKQAWLTWPDHGGKTYSLDVNYVILNQMVHLWLDGLSFPYSSLVGDPVLIGAITILTGSTGQGAGTLTRNPLPMPTVPIPIPKP